MRAREIQSGRNLVARSTGSLECHHVTGEDCFFIKLAVDSLAGLEQVVERFRAHGKAVVTVALSCVTENKPVDLRPSEVKPDE